MKADTKLEKSVFTDEKHEDIIDENLPHEEEIYELADLFKIFSDSTRLKILCVLYETQMCVYDISSLLNMSQSAISHQLRILKQSKLVKYKREGKNIFYSLSDNHINTIIGNGLEHIRE